MRWTSTNGFLRLVARATLLVWFFAALALCTPPPGWAHSDPATDGLIDGGGSPRTDCVSKFQTGIELNYKPPPAKARELRCTDGDLACDTDGVVNDSCTINVGVCLLDDEDLQVCAPTGIPAGGVRLKNKPLGHRKHDAQLQLLQDEIDALLGGTGLPCDNPGAGGGNCFSCTASQVPITFSAAVKKGKKKIKLKAATDPAPPKNRPIKDNDKLKMRCVGCPSTGAFEHIANTVFRTGCAASAVCHTGPAPQGGLNLNIDEVGSAALYDAVVGPAFSPGAAALGLDRVLPGDPNLGTGASASLIFEKLARSNSELDQLCLDGGQFPGCLGIHMPPGSDGFSTGKLDLIRKWIEAGAPADGWPAGTTCGEPEDIWLPADPPPAPAASEGFQVHMARPEGFVLKPGTEFEGCQWVAAPNTVTETWYINRVELVANIGTHHILIWEDLPDSGPTAVPTAFDSRDPLCGKNFGVKFSRVGSQDPTSTQILPSNVTFVMEPGKVLGFNIHYTNPFNIPIYPEVWINFYGSTTPSLVEAGSIFPGDLGFSIAPGTVGEGSLSSYRNNTGQDQCYYSLSSHMHRRGTGFKIWTSRPSSWNDTNNLVYFNTDWDHPAVLEPSPRLLLPAGGKLWFQCQWDNGVLNDVTRRCRPTVGGRCEFGNQAVCFSSDDCGPGTTGLCENCELNFGFLAEDEMCFMPGSYYPAQAGPDPCPW